MMHTQYPIALLPLYASTRLLRSDDGVQEPADHANDYYYTDGAYYYLETTDDQE